MTWLKDNYGYLCLIILVAISGWLVKLSGLDDFNRIIAPEHSPDYFSKGYTKLEMSELGRLKSKLMAEELIHYSDNGVTDMLKPVMFFYNDKTPPWVIKSDTGILSADGKDLLLNGKVYVDRAASRDTRELKIFTSDLKVKPETSYAETNKWAELISLPNWTTGIGMKLVFAEPIHLELLSHVKGSYEKK
jgi:lipopolysaccharide export system protein LptC